MPQQQGKVVGRTPDGQAIVELANGQRVTTGFDKISVGGPTTPASSTNNQTGSRPAGLVDRQPSIVDRLKGMLPELVGAGVGLAGIGGTSGFGAVAAPALAAGATTLLRDWLDPNAEVSADAIAGHTLMNAGPGLVGQALKAPRFLGGLATTRFPMLARILGVGERMAPAAAGAGKGAGAIVDATKAMTSGIESAVLADGSPLVSSAGLKHLAEEGVRLENSGASKQVIKQVDALYREVADAVEAAKNSTAGRLKAAGIGQATAPAPIPVPPDRTIPNIVSGLRGTLAAGSAYTAPASEPSTAPKRRELERHYGLSRGF